MSSDVFRKVGRGGAGNFYSDKDVQQPDRAGHQDGDLEAQHISDLPVVTTSGGVGGGGGGGGLIRAGRGGAGNFHEPSTDPVPGGSSSHRPAAVLAAERDHLAERMRAAVSASIAKLSRAAGAGGTGGTGLSGRGGAGNWVGPAAAATTAAEGEEKKLMAALDARVLQEVEADLPPPPKTYHLHDRDMA